MRILVIEDDEKIVSFVLNGLKQSGFLVDHACDGDAGIIELQNREFALLELLMRHPGRPVTKTMILEHIWDYSFDPQTNVVDVLAHRLRSKVQKNFPRKILQTIRAVGYVRKAT